MRICIHCGKERVNNKCHHCGWFAGMSPSGHKKMSYLVYHEHEPFRASYVPEGCLLVLSWEEA